MCPRFGVLDTLEDPEELWDTYKCETLEAAKECIGERPRLRSGFTSVETLESIEESRAARLAGDQDQYNRALSRRTRTLLRRDKERYVRGLRKGQPDLEESKGTPTELLAAASQCLLRGSYLV